MTFINFSVIFWKLAAESRYRISCGDRILSHIASDCVLERSLRPNLPKIGRDVRRAGIIFLNASNPFLDSRNVRTQSFRKVPAENGMRRGDNQCRGRMKRHEVRTHRGLLFERASRILPILRVPKCIPLIAHGIAHFENLPRSFVTGKQWSEQLDGKCALMPVTILRILTGAMQ